MGLEELVERIRKDTAREVSRIRAEAEKEAGRIEADAKAREDAQVRRGLESRRTQLEFDSRRKISSRESDLKRAFLDERETLLRDVLASLEMKLADLPAEEEKALLSSLVGGAKRQIATGRIRVSNRGRELLAGLLSGYKTEADESLNGGFVVESEDGLRSMDLTFAALVDAFWLKHRIDVARALVGEELSSGKISS